jgi:preprotein translocase SecE subunit
MFQSISRWVNGVASEIRAITWPSQKKVYSDTVVVVAALVVGGIIIGFLDYGLLSLFKYLISSIS